MFKDIFFLISAGEEQTGKRKEIATGKSGIRKKIFRNVIISKGN